VQDIACIKDSSKQTTNVGRLYT